MLDFLGVARLLWRTAICAALTYTVSICADIGYQKLINIIKLNIAEKRHAEVRRK